MTKREIATSDLIAAAALTSSLSPRTRRDKASGCTGECAGCPFSLEAFSLALHQAEQRRRKSRENEKP